MRYNVLVLTDHTTHAVSNSLYKLSSALQEDIRSNNVWVCTRGHPGNRDFFNGNPDAEIYATSIQAPFTFDPSGAFLIQNAEIINANKVHAILLRLPQPLDIGFLLSLEQLVPAEKIINQPRGTIETSSKQFLMQVAHLCPDPSMCYSIDDAIALSHQYEIVLKPLYSYGGKGIIRLSGNHVWVGNRRHEIDRIFEILSPQLFPMMAMRYLRNVTKGDKRTIIINQKVMGSAVRMPGPDSWICNVAQGSHAYFSEVDEDEQRIEAELTPLLYQKGVIFYGFDSLADDDGRRVLSEINTLSIGGLGPMEAISGKPIVKEAAGLLLDYLTR
ncbi:MAG: hypothetical protein M3R25_10995 [Bacteroidota bacterium]|nr:hypothetical protein [Bacteroidota bacterium]